MPLKKSLILVLGFWFLALGLSGCATMPQRTALPTYHLHGADYLALVSLCDAMGINLDYDTFTRSATLTKGAHRMNLMAGQSMVLVDGDARDLNYPVDIYQGAMVVPYKFKEQVLDVLFGRQYAARQAMPALRIRKVVVDAGHGGKDPGAIGKSGLREKDVNLDIAKRLSALLKKEGIDAVMTRSTDVFISLERRVDIANRSGADLFISVHSNANRVRGMNGFEAYYVSVNVSDSKRASSAAGNGALNLNKGSFAGYASEDLKKILWDMIYTSDRADAVRLSRNICRSIDANLNTRVLGIKGANYYVLKGAQMPAVLLEVGFLSNSAEERLLRNNFYRQQIAEAIVSGVEDYARDYRFAQAAN